MTPLFYVILLLYNMGSMQKIKGKKLRIALLSYRSKTTCGGQGIYIQGLTQALIDLGHDVDVISGPPYSNICSNAKLIKMPSLSLFENPSFFPKKWWRIFLNWPNFIEWFLARLGTCSTHTRCSRGAALSPGMRSR